MPPDVPVGPWFLARNRRSLRPPRRNRKRPRPAPSPWRWEKEKRCNAIWSAGYGTRFKLRGGIWQKDSGLGRGQWGLCQDDFGRLYFNYNSDMLRADLLPTEAFTRNPLLRNASSINAAKAHADMRLPGSSFCSV